MMYNRKSIRTITEPTGLAVSLVDMKLFLAVEGAADDALITDFIEVATESVKQYIQRSILTETLEFTMDGFTAGNDDAMLSLGAGTHTGHRASIMGAPGEFDLPFPPVASVTSLTTYSVANVAAVFDAASYKFDGNTGRLYLNEGYTWPTDLRARSAVVVEYVTGFAIIPKPILQGIKQMVAIMYECREICELPEGCKAILAPYRRMDAMAW